MHQLTISRHSESQISRADIYFIFTKSRRLGGTQGPRADATCGVFVDPAHPTRGCFLHVHVSLLAVPWCTSASSLPAGCVQPVPWDPGGWHLRGTQRRSCTERLPCIVFNNNIPTTSLLLYNTGRAKWKTLRCEWPLAHFSNTADFVIAGGPSPPSPAACEERNTAVQPVANAL